MKRTLIPLLLFAIGIFSISITLSASPQRSKSKPQPKVDIVSIVDSALIMADEYAEALASKPEVSAPRLNVLKKYYSKLRDVAAQDSVRGMLYNLYVQYVESDKPERADAFRRCFLSVASDSDEHLGPMYANDLQMARERMDTTAMKENIELLDAYARRMNYDYDEELTSARDFLHHVRTRKPIRDAIVGVWVSEDMAGIYDPKTGGKFFYFKEKDAKLINSTKVLQIRDTDNPVYRDYIVQGKYRGNELYVSLDSINNQHSSGQRNLDVIKSRMFIADVCPIGSTPWYVPIEAWELPGYNMQPLDSAYIASVPVRGTAKFDVIKNHNIEHLSRMTAIDENAYSIYAFWGDERLKRNNAEIGAILRQTTQNLRATVAGQLSRSKYSTSDRLLGNFTSELVGMGANALIDALMVSKEEIWSVETTLHMENPYMLIADIHAQKITAKSNSNKPEVLDYNHTTRYYRWEPQDSVFFMGTYHSVANYHPWSYDGGLVFLHDMTKDDKNKCKKRADVYKEKWKNWFNQSIKEQKEKIKKLPKGSAERKQAEEALKDFKDRRTPQIWIHWNEQMINKLKAKAENYKL